MSVEYILNTMRVRIYLLTTNSIPSLLVGTRTDVTFLFISS